MLTIIVPASEGFNEETQQFVTTKETTLVLEHSLVSISKWESKWKKSFMDFDSRNGEESLDYIKCMTVTQNVDPNVYMAFTPSIFKQITDYISDPMTATTFRAEQSQKGRGEKLTSELIYYYMTAFNIPWEAQKWHINRLLTLIKVCNIKNQPPKKMSKSDLMSRNRALNEARRAQLGTKG